MACGRPVVGTRIGGPPGLGQAVLLGFTPGLVLLLVGLREAAVVEAFQIRGADGLGQLACDRRNR
jgi:hypothetical protein